MKNDRLPLNVMTERETLSSLKKESNEKLEVFVEFFSRSVKLVGISCKRMR